MNFDEASEELPFPVRQYLETSLIAHGLPKTDPIVSVALVQAYLTEVIDKRRRRGIYWVAALLVIVVGIISAFGGYEVGKSALGGSILRINGEHKVEAIWVHDGKTYLQLK